MFITVIFIASVLRFWKLFETMPFIGDFGWYYLQAKDVLTQGYLPLVGIPSSVPVLQQGVLWTYMLAGALFLGNFHPLSGGILGSFLGVAGVMLTYYFGSKLYSKKVALIASFLAATFPFIVLHDRIPFQTTAIFPATAVFAYLTHLVYKKADIKNTFLLGLCWGILFQLELAAIILIPAILVVYLIKSVKMYIKYTLNILAGAFWGNITFFLSDWQNGVFIQTVGFAAWFIQKAVENYFLLIGVIILVIFRKLLLYLKKVEFNSLFVIIWAGIGSLAFLTRGVYSEAYFPLIYFPFLIIIAFVFDFFIRKNKILGCSFLAVVVSVNTFLVFLDISKMEKLGSGLASQIKVADFIDTDNDSKELTFNYIGPGMQFHTTGAEWEYLFWWKGIEYSKQLNADYAIIDYHYNDLDGYSIKGDFGSYKVAQKK